MRDAHARQSLADAPEFIATIGDSGGGPTAATKKEAAAARTSARVIKAARALSAAPSPPDAPTPSPSDNSVRAAHPRRLVNFFPESALQPEQSSTSLPTEAESQTALTSKPVQMVSHDSQPAAAAQSGATPSVIAAPASSIDSVSQVLDASERTKTELLAAIREGGGPALLTGPAGVGKTTLCRTLIQELDRRTIASVVSGAPQSFDDLLKTMLVGFGVMTTESPGAAHVAQSVLVSTLDAFLESLVVLRATAVVFIDDAHKIPAGVLAEVAAMRTPGSPSARVLQFVLVGRPSLRSLLKRPDLRNLDASIVRRTSLVPFRVNEPVGDAAPPAVLNTAPNDSSAVDFDLDASRSGSLMFKRLVLLAAVALVVLAGALWVWRDAVSRTLLQ